MTTPLLTVNKFPVLTRSNFTQASSVTFPVGGVDDQTPIINLALTSLTAAERIVQYLDIGQTDAAKDLDVITTTTMVPLYLDPAYVESSGSAMLGYLPPKCVMVRCLAGSGFLYVNPPDPLDDVAMLKVVPFTLHAGLGLFSYAFPRGNVHAAVATDPTDPTKKLPYPLALVSLYLRTFEAYNRFQVVIFK
jgi:hypothetical protein